MVLPARWLGLLTVCLCGSGISGVFAQEVVTPAAQLWQQGQEALRQRRTDEAIQCFEQSLAADPGLDRNHLSLAAAYLEKGDESHACPHLARYLTAHPDHLVIRAHYAELLLRCNQPEEARSQFRCLAADAQAEGDAGRQLIHCHSRLMEIAERTENPYDEHLHRGIGLFLLACERAALPDPEGDLAPEGLLCRAAAELTLARMACPDEAQPSWYLYEVWSRLQQRQPALRSLREADEAAPFSYLTPAEQASLYLACRRHEPQSLRK